MRKPEPVMIAAIVPLLVSLAARHGVTLPSEIVADVLQGALVIAAAWWARGRVSPVQKSKPAPPAS